MRVPVIGVGVAVQRVWIRMPRTDEHVDVMWCGAQLSQNSSTAERSWWGFVDALVGAASTSSDVR